MTWASRSQPIQVGDRVAYSASFLRSIGCFTGDMPHARGRVTGLESLGGGIVLAIISWDGDPADLPEKVNIKNLSRVDPQKGVLDL